MKTKDLTRTAVFTALICAASVIFRYVPASIVPYSILPLLVLLAGFVLGPKQGALAMTVYTLLGIVGFPIFATAPFGGITYVLKPTFGYLLGYILAAYVVGKVLGLKSKPGLVLSVFAVVCGLAVIYSIGLGYLLLLLNLGLHKPTSVYQALQIGFIPFIALDLVKGLVAAILGKALKTRLEMGTDLGHGASRS